MGTKLKDRYEELGKELELMRRIRLAMLGKISSTGQAKFRILRIIDSYLMMRSRIRQSPVLLRPWPERRAYRAPFDGVSN